MDTQQICPECGSGHTTVKTSRYFDLSNKWIECEECGSKWLIYWKVSGRTTYPQQEALPCR